MTLEEIFSTNPSLLETPEVKKLIEYVREQHTITFNIVQGHLDKEHEILKLLMYSEKVLIEGNSCSQTLDKLLELISK